MTGFVELRSVAAYSVDSLVEDFISHTEDIENGCFVEKDGYSTAYGETLTWVAKTPTGVHDLCMVYNAGETIITLPSGNQITGGSILDYTNVKDRAFNAYHPQKHDRVKMTADLFEGTEAAYAIVATGKKKLQFASAPIDGISYKILKKESFDIPTPGKLLGVGTPAYVIECVAI